MENTKQTQREVRIAPLIDGFPRRAPGRTLETETSLMGLSPRRMQKALAEIDQRR